MPFFILISRLFTPSLLEIYFRWIPGTKKRILLFSQIVYWKFLYNILPVTGAPVVRWKKCPLSFFSWQLNTKIVSRYNLRFSCNRHEQDSTHQKTTLNMGIPILHQGFFMFSKCTGLWAHKHKVKIQ